VTSQTHLIKRKELPEEAVNPSQEEYKDEFSSSVFVLSSSRLTLGDLCEDVMGIVV